jgi:flavodoxin
MKILIVYDSFFGNTEQIAQAMAAALEAPEEVTLLKVDAVQPQHLEGLAYLIVGSPTRGFRPSPATTSLLKSIPRKKLEGVRVAAFDTRVPIQDIKRPAILDFLVKIFGYAADPIGKKLQQKGGKVVVPAEGFYVMDTEGPLKDGELERATAWIRKVTAAQ